jgi:hypothetical protein
MPFREGEAPTRTGFHITAAAVPAPHNLQGLNEAFGLPADMVEPQNAEAPERGSYFFKQDEEPESVLVP